MPEGSQSRVRWFLVFGLFILSAVAFLDRVNISIAGNSIAAEYHLSNIQLGWIFSTFLWGYALFQTFGGWLADRFGPRRVLTAGVLWWGIFTAMTAAVSTRIAFAVVLFAAVRFLLGAGEAIIYPASNQFVSRWIPSPERGIANGLIFAGVGFGAGVTPVLVTYVTIHFGWRSSFWMSAIIGLIAGAAWYLAARDMPEQHAFVSPSELAHIQAGRTAKAAGGGRIPWSTIFASKEVLALTLSYFSFGYVAWIFFNWFFIYLANVRGLNLKASAFYTTLPFLAMAACSPLGGAISDKLTKLFGKRAGRCGIAIFGLVLTAAFLVLGSQVQSARLASLVLAGGAGALYLSQSSYWSVTADIASASSGSVSGLMNMGNQLGAAITVILTPFLASRFRWTTSFFVAAGLSVLGAVAWLFVDPERSLSPEAHLSSGTSETSLPCVIR
jgi:ACS family glucarate transporter-like MFS transporter